MNTPTSDLEFFAGDSKRLRFSIVDEAGNPVDLSGDFALTWSLFPAEKQAAKVVKRLCDGDITIEDAPGGVCVVSIASGDTKDLAGLFDHELVYVDSDIRSVIHKGQIRFAKTKTP